VGERSFLESLGVLGIPYKTLSLAEVFTLIYGRRSQTGQAPPLWVTGPILKKELEMIRFSAINLVRPMVSKI
jgi:hypothetical protein